jgi:hypothetical protein
MRDTIALCDRFPDTHQNGRARIDARLRRYLAAIPV